VIGVALGIAATTLVVGCGPPVIGEWESSAPVQDQRNQLVVDDLNVAEATVWILRTVDGEPTAQSFEFDVEWEERREGTAYSFDMACAESPYGECDEEDDFRMLCDLENDDEALACEVDDNMRWEVYDFAWRKVE
jgi:hypothetical protein